MGIINGENLKAISKAFKKEFQDSYAKVEVNYPKVATEVKSNTISTDYTWLGDFPKMKEWIGDRAVQDLTAHKYTITKKRVSNRIISPNLFKKEGLNSFSLLAAN